MGEFEEEGGEEVGSEDPEMVPVEGVDPVEGLACGPEGFAVVGVGE